MEEDLEHEAADHEGYEGPVEDRDRVRRSAPSAESARSARARRPGTFRRPRWHWRQVCDEVRFEHRRIGCFDARDMFTMFGGKGAREGVVTKVAVKGDRMLTRSGESGQLVDLPRRRCTTSTSTTSRTR